MLSFYTERLRVATFKKRQRYHQREPFETLNNVTNLCSRQLQGQF